MLYPPDEIVIKNKLANDQLFKISRFKDVIKRTAPYKHDGYFELIYLSAGAGFHWIDTQKFQITPAVVYFLSGQLHYWVSIKVINPDTLNEIDKIDLR